MRKTMPSLLLILLALSCKGDNGGFFSGNSRPDVPDYNTGTDDTGERSDDTADTADSGDSADSDSADTSDSGDTTIPGSDDCGTGLNDIACNIVTTDARGSAWELWDLYGTPTVLVFGNAYDQQLQNISGYLQGVATANDAAAAVILFAGLDQIAADTSDAAAWATTYGLSDVLIDPDGQIRADWSPSSFTTTVMLDADMRVVWVSYGYVDEAQMDDRLEDL